MVKRLADQIEERIVCQALWAILFRRAALSMEELAARLPHVPDLRARVARLSAAGLLDVDSQGSRVFGIYGIGLLETAHSLRMGKGKLFARTLSDALCLFDQLGESGVVQTPCPTCGSRISLEMRQGRVRRIRPWIHRLICPCQALDAVRAFHKNASRWEDR